MSGAASEEPVVTVTIGPSPVEVVTAPPSTSTPALPLPTQRPTRSRRPGRSRGLLTPSPTPVVTSAPTPASTPDPVTTLSPAASPAPTTATGNAHGLTPGLFAKQADRAYDLVGGTWTCRTFAGTPIEHIYRRAKDAESLDVDTALAIDGQKVRLHETYRFRDSTERWTVSLDSGQFVATAAPWTGETWTFSGINTANGRAFDSSMKYKRVNADEFTRSFDRTDGGVTKTYSGERCLRVLP